MIATNYNPLSKTVNNSTLILTCKILTTEKKGNFTMEMSGRHQLNQVNKLLLSVIKQNPGSPKHNVTSVMFLPKMPNLNQIMRNMRQLQTENHSTK